MSDGTVSFEARDLWKLFASPEDGAMVMDGAGIVFRFDAASRFWTDGRRRVKPLRLAQALCPDLAEDFAALGEGQDA